MLEVSRRGLIGILAAAMAPAIIRTPGLLMPIREDRNLIEIEGYDHCGEIVMLRRWMVFSCRHGGCPIRSRFTIALASN